MIYKRRFTLTTPPLGPKRKLLYVRDQLRRLSIPTNAGDRSSLELIAACGSNWRRTGLEVFRGEARRVRPNLSQGTCLPNDQQKSEQTDIYSTSTVKTHLLHHLHTAVEAVSGPHLQCETILYL